MKGLITVGIGLVLLGSTAAVAQLGPHNIRYNQGDRGQYQDQRQNSEQRSGPRYEDGFSDGYKSGYDTARGGRAYNDRYSKPDKGGQQARWRQRYSKTYTYTDDSFYQQCRSSADPAGVIAGALIGGLLGNAVSNGGGRAPATVAGVILGGALGGALTKNLDCEDRSYAYKTYYDGFNAGRPNASYEWRNQRNGHYGTFRVADYYNDPDGFRCANYTQQIFINGRPQSAIGRACQQPDRTWAIVG